MIWPARAVADTRGGPNLEVLVDPDVHRIRSFWTPDRWEDDDKGAPPPEYAELADVLHPGCDVAIFQRPMEREQTLIFERMRAKGIAVIVDLDDNFDAVDVDNIAWFAAEPYWHHEEAAKVLARQLDRRLHVTQRSSHGWLLLPDYPGRTHRGWITRALAHVDLLTVSTPALADHYGPFVRDGRVKVIRNHIPARYLDITRPPNDRPVVGWTGTIQTHPKDLDVCGDAIARAKDDADFELRIIGTGAGCRDRWGVDPDSVTGWRPIEEYPTDYAGLDVVLCPLNDSAFNAAKSYLKPLEAISLGVVPIMSPSPEYLRLHKRHGVGLIARTPDDWYRHITRLVADPDLRARMAAHGRQVARALTIEGNAHLWADAWQSAADNAQRRLARNSARTATTDGSCGAGSCSAPTTHG